MKRADIYPSTNVCVTTCATQSQIGSFGTARVFSISSSFIEKNCRPCECESFELQRLIGLISRGTKFSANTYAIDVIDVITMLNLQIHMVHVVFDFAHAVENTMQIDDACGHAHINWFAQIQQIRRCLGGKFCQQFVVVGCQQMLQIFANLSELMN